MSIISGSSLKVKLVLSFLVIAFGALLTSGFQLFQLVKISKQVKHIAEVNLVNQTNLAKLDGSLKSLKIHLSKMRSVDMTASGLEEAILYVNEAHSDFEKYLSMYASIANSEAEAKSIKELGSMYVLQKQEVDLLNGMVSKNSSLAMEKIRSDKMLASGSHLEPVSSLLSDLIVKENELGYKSSQEISADTKKSLYISIGAIAGFFIFSIIYALFLSKNFSKDLVIAANIAAKSAEQLEKTSLNIYQSSASLSSGVESQSDSIQSSVSAIVQISSMVEKISSESKQSLAQAVQGEELSVAGSKAIQEMKDCLSEIFSATEGLLEQIYSNNKKIEDLEKVFLQVSSKTELIDEVVSQTKLLSFNASIEAARAGEFGKGFSVVAMEMGKLARLSGEAAGEINQILGNSVSLVKTMSQESKVSADNWSLKAQTIIDKGQNQGQITAEMLDKIYEMSKGVTDKAKRISSAIEEQQKGIQEINSTFQKLEKITEESSQTAKKNREIADLISQESQNSRKSVEKIETLITGAKNKKRDGELGHPLNINNKAA